MTETPPITAEDAPAVRRLTRSRDGRWFGGVCAGLGRYFDISPSVYRLAFAALALAGGAGILIYLAAWLVIPDEGREASAGEQALRNHRDRPGLAIAVGLLGLAVIIGLSNITLWPHPGNLWLAALLVGGALVWWELHGRRAQAPAVAPGEGAGPMAAPLQPQPRGRSLFGPVVGVLIVGAGLLGLLSVLDVPLFDLRIALAGAVVLVGAAIAAGAFLHSPIGGLLGLGILLVLALVVAASVHVPFRGGVGDRLVRPATIADLD